MNYAIDWSNTKKFVIFDILNEKYTKINPNIENFQKFLDTIEPSKFYLEEGGADTFKILADRNNHEVYTIPGIKVQELREELDVEKTDENDAKLIGYLSNNGHFKKFTEYDKLTYTIKVLYKEYCDIEYNIVMTKNRTYALKKRFETVGTNKIFEKREETLKSLSMELNEIKKLLLHYIKKHDVYQKYLKDIKGVGTIIAGGLISRIGYASRFRNKYNLRNYAGMKPLKGDQNFDHKLKKILYYVVEGFIKHRTPVWRELYETMKIYYAEKHPDYSKGYINNLTKKRVQTKFLDELYKNMIIIEKN